MWGRRYNKNPSFFFFHVICRHCFHPLPVHLTSAIVFQMVFFPGSSMEIPGKVVVPELGVWGELRKELESGIFATALQLPQPGNLGVPTRLPLPQNPRGWKRAAGPSLWETNREPLAGGRKSLLTHAQPGLGALLLSEKLILGICTELFIVKAALIPRVSKSPWKKISCAREAVEPVRAPPKKSEFLGLVSGFQITVSSGGLF